MDLKACYFARMELNVQGQSTYVYTGERTFSANLPVVVLIHGAQQDHSCWNYQTNWLADQEIAVLAPDLPGHGRSGGSPLSSIEEMSDWIVALLNVMRIQQAMMVGHSMGSLIAIETVLRYSERVPRLVLIGSSVPMRVSPALLDAAWHNETKAAAMVNAFSFSSQVQANGNAGAAMMEANLRIMEQQKPGVFGCDMNACNAYARPITDLSAISQSALVIVGDQDRMTPTKASQAVAAATPKSTLVIIKDAGHALMIEQPDAVLDHLRSFLV